MKNLGTLYRYELKKLLKRKLSWIAVIVLTAFCIYGVIKIDVYPGNVEIPIMDENDNWTGEGIFISGEEIYNTYLKSAGKLDGRIMDDGLFQEMLENVPDMEANDLSIFFWTEDATYKHVYTMLDGLFTDPRSVTAEEFYAVQWEQTQLSWDNYGAGNEGISEGEKDYWTEQAAKIEKPFIYHPPWRGTSALIDFFHTLITLLPVAAAVCVCTIFSEDHRTRMDALVFSTRKSRFPLYLAKVLAGTTIVTLTGVFIVGATVAAHLAIWGIKGFDACIQMYMIVSPRAITVGQMLLIMSMLLVLYTMLCGGLAMLVAAITRSTIVALVIPVLLVQVLDRFRPGQYGWGGYFPNNLIGKNGANNVELVDVFGVYLNNFQFGPLLYLAITMFLLALCWLVWRRNVKGI